MNNAVRSKNVLLLAQENVITLKSSIQIKFNTRFQLGRYLIFLLQLICILLHGLVSIVSRNVDSKPKMGINFVKGASVLFNYLFSYPRRHTMHCFFIADDLADFDIRTGSDSVGLTTNQLCYHYDGVMQQGMKETFYCIQPLVPSLYVSIHLVICSFL